MNFRKFLAFSKIDYLNGFIVFQFAMVPFWYSNKAFSLGVFLFFLFQIIRKERRIPFDSKLFVIMSVHVLIAVIQGIIWKLKPFSILTSFVLVIYTAYLVFRLYRFSLLELLENVFFRMMQISFSFYFLLTFIPNARSLFYSAVNVLAPFNGDSYDRSILLFTHWDQLDAFLGPFPRFAGFCHEPGANGALLLLFILYNYWKGYSIFHRRNILYIACMFFTFSSAAQLSFVLALGGILLTSNSQYRAYVIVVFPLFIIGGVFLYNSIDFFSNKIENQIEAQNQLSLDTEATGRIIGYRKSIYVLGKYPLFGRGVITATKPSNPSHREYTAYGWLNYIAGYGLIVGGAFMLLFYKGFRNFFISSESVRGVSFLFFFLAIMINLTAQSLISSIIFFYFFLHGVYGSSNGFKALNNRVKSITIRN